MRSGKRLVLVVAAGVTVATAIALTVRHPASPPVDSSPGGYVGSAACGSCHAAQVQAWERSAHHFAMLPASPAAPLRAPRGGPLTQRDGSLVLAGASVGYTSDLTLGYALGRRRVEQYVAALGPERLQALPLAFDVQHGEWFDLFAGEVRAPADWGHWTNRGMNANAQCLFCHTTGYQKGYRPTTDDYASGWAEMGVGCEACHGPGAAHAAARSAWRGGSDPYAKRTPGALLDACAACHTRRVERAPFTPGDSFLDAFEPDLPDTDAYYADGQVRDELYEVVSFQMSRMYAAGVRCWSCHDVHGGGTRQVGNTLCLGCHEPDQGTPAHTHHALGSPGAQCVACHMPMTVYMQRDPRHDDSFARPDPAATAALGIPNACTRCHAEQPAGWAAARMAEWYPDDGERARRRAVASSIAAARGDDAASIPALRSLLAGDADAIRRATAARLLARFPTGDGVAAALLAALADGEPLVRTGAAWAIAQRDTVLPEARDGLVRALTDPVRVVRLEAALGLRAVDPSTLDPTAAAALAAATAEWRRSQELVADTPEAHYNLAIFHAARGEGDAAVAEYRAALRLWPSSIQVHHNLGMLLADLGRPGEAADEFRAVLARQPVPETAFALGLLEAQQARWPEAAQALEQCLAANPSYPRARYNLGLAYARAGQTARALDTLEQAAADPDTHAEAVRALVDLSRATNDRTRLTRWSPEAARLDPSVAEDPKLQNLLNPK